MLTAEWGVLGCVLLLAAPLAWLEVRYMARRDRDPEEAEKWPEWWAGNPVQTQEAPETLGRAA